MNHAFGSEQRHYIDTKAIDNPKQRIGPRFAATRPSAHGTTNHGTPILANVDALPEILTAKELEALLRIDVKTIYRYAELGILPYLRMESNLRFPKHQVLRWLEERNFRPRSVNGNGAKKRRQ